MEVDAADSHHHHHQHQPKRPRVAAAAAAIGNGAAASEEGEDLKARRLVGRGGGGVGVGVGGGGVVPWQHPSSRIYRVSRASGGKDRHSKVYTAKGIRDRRVRLSVSTAIQFYDLQDRLGYDQPSKAIEWLIKAASAAIDKLPSLDGSFPDAPPPKPHVSDDADGCGSQHQPQQQLTKSGCSSTSETSKGSVLSLSRSESRVKARERARERAAKDKEKDAVDDVAAHRHRAAANQNVASSQTASFTELLTGVANATNGPTVMSTAANSTTRGHKQSWQLPTAAAADYLSFVQSPRKPHHQMPSGFSSPTAHFGNVAPIGMAPAPPFNFTAASPAVGEQHPEMTQFSFVQDHFIPVNAVAAPTSAAAGDYNLNFSISSGLVGVNRGTLQSNSPSQFASHQQLQRLSSPLDAPNIPFFFSAATAAAPDAGAAAFDGRLQLWDGFRHSDMKEKGKN